MTTRVIDRLRQGVHKYAAATPPTVTPPKPAVAGLPDPIAPIKVPGATGAPQPKTPATPVTLPTERGQPVRAPAFQSRPTPGAPAAPATGPVGAAAPTGPGAGPTGSEVAGPAAGQPALTSPAATQPNPQGGPSPAQKPPAAQPEPAAQQPAPAPAQTAPPQPAPVSTHVGAADKAFADVLPQLSDEKTPLPQRQEVAKTRFAQHLKQNPLYEQGLQDIRAGNTNTEGARALQANMDQYKNTLVYDEFNKLKQANPTADFSDPSTYASFLGQASNTAMTKFNEMPMEHKLLTGLGLGGGLIGILSSLFGGGMGGGLLGLLGLGVGGMAGAAGGMFGDQAQAATGKLIGDMGNFFGMIPDEARDANNFNEAAAKATKKRIADAMAATLQDEKTRGQGAQIGQQMLNEERAKFEPLRALHQKSPQAAYSILMGMNNGPKTPQEAAQLYERLNKQYEMAGQEGYLYSQTLENIRARQQNPQTLEDRMMGFLKPEDIMKGMGFKMPEPQQKRGASMTIAQEIYFKQAALKAARCWAGYEPVPGKAPYSENSCRPKRKKKKEKQPAK